MDTPTFISNYQSVVDLYGRWPAFHDAKVRAYVPPTPENPSITLTLHTWQMTNEVDATGHYISRNHALVSFRFDEIFDVEMDHFGADNILFGLEFFPGGDGSFQVVLDSVMDKSGSFSARKAEVSAIPCTRNGQSGDNRSMP